MSQKITYGKVRKYYKHFLSLSKEEQAAYAVLNHKTIDEIISSFQEICFDISYLSDSQKRTFRKELESMTPDELEAVSKINNLPICEIKAQLDSAIAQYNSENAHMRDFDKAWKLREKEVFQQLIQEGIVRPTGKNSYEMDFIEHRRRMLSAKAELAKEMGLHLVFHDPFVGRFES